MRYQLHFDGYEIFNHLSIGNMDISIGMKDVYGEEPFIVIESYGEDYQTELTYSSYIEAMTGYCTSILQALDDLKAEYEILEIPETPLNADDCHMDTSQLVGKPCVLEADALAPDKRTANCQLFYVEGQLSLDGDNGDTAYLSRCLFDGKLSFLKERQILGVADAEAMPLWAVKKYTALSQQARKFDPETDVVSQDSKFYNRAVHIVMGTENDLVEEII